jgi:hypothetical protein
MQSKRNCAQNGASSGLCKCVKELSDSMKYWELFDNIIISFIRRAVFCVVTAISPHPLFLFLSFSPVPFRYSS